MTRIGMIPEVQFAEDFKQLRRDIEAIKNAQRIGRDIMRPKIVEALDEHGDPTPYDLVTTAAELFTRADFTCTLLAENQTEPWGSLFVKAFYGSPDVPILGGQMDGLMFLSQQKTLQGSIGYTGFITGQFNDLTPLYLKFFMYSSDTGTLEILPESVN